MLDLACQDIFRHHHTDITAHCRKFCDSFILSVKGSKLHDRGHIQHSYIGSVANSIGGCNGRMHLSHITDNSSFIDNICLASRMKEGLSCIGVIVFLAAHTDLIQEFLYHAFHGIEISIPVHTQSKDHSLIRQLC